MGKNKKTFTVNPWVVWCESEDEDVFLGVSLDVESAKELVPLSVPAAGKYLYEGLRNGWSVEECLKMLRKKTGHAILAAELDFFLNQLVECGLLTRSRSRK